MDGSVIDYLEEYIEQIIMEEFKEPEYEQDKLSFMEEICKKYWNNSAVRRYCIDRYFERKDYDRVLQVLDESIKLDKAYQGLVLEYNQKKKEIYRLQGNKSAYIE